MRQSHPSRISWWRVFTVAATEWQAHKVPRLGAALAYYTVFSIAPLLVIVTAIAAFVFGREAVDGQLQQQLRGFLGADGAQAVQSLLADAYQPGSGMAAVLLGLGTLVIGASAVFGQLKDALNTIWEVQPKPGSTLLTLIRDEFLSFAMVLCIGFLLLVSLVISSALAAVHSYSVGLLPGQEALFHAANLLASFLVVTLLFALIFKVLPDAYIAWRDVWSGALLTAVLFELGKLLIGLYLGNASVGSSYGAAGSIIVILIWAYYSAQILLFGAELTHAYAVQRAGRVVPVNAPAPLPGRSSAAGA